MLQPHSIHGPIRMGRFIRKGWAVLASTMKRWQSRDSLSIFCRSKEYPELWRASHPLLVVVAGRPARWELLFRKGKFWTSDIENELMGVAGSIQLVARAKLRIEFLTAVSIHAISFRKQTSRRYSFTAWKSPRLKYSEYFKLPPAIAQLKQLVKFLLAGRWL